MSVLSACGAAGGSSGPGGTPSTAATAPAGSGATAAGGTSSAATDPQGGAASSAPAVGSHKTEDNPPGDIPDQQVFVAYTPPGAHFSVKVPEGWARSTGPDGVTFTDKLNSITVQEVQAPQAPTEAQARAQLLPELARTVPAFAEGKVAPVSRTPGRGVLLTYLGDSAPDPVTNKVVRDAFQRYLFWHNGHQTVLTLAGPTNADNVDPWRTVTDSVTWL